MIQRKTNQKHNTLCVGHHYAQTNTNNVNTTCNQQGKGEPNIVFTRKPQWISQHATLNVKTHYRTTQKIL